MHSRWHFCLKPRSHYSNSAATSDQGSALRRLIRKFPINRYALLVAGRSRIAVM